MNRRFAFRSAVWLTGILTILGSSSSDSDKDPPSMQIQFSPDQPQAGQLVQFSATGGDNVTPSEDLVLEWFFNEDTVSDGSGRTAHWRFEATGTYQVRLYAKDQKDNSATVTKNVVVQAAAVAPVITTQPADVSVAAGNTATFSVFVSGTTPINYQWSRNGVAIAGATAANFSTAVTTSADTGSQYSVVVSNSAGSITSRTATLTVTSVSAGGSWRPLLIASVDASAPQRRVRSVAVNTAGDPFVAFREGTSIRVMRSDGTTWTAIGGAVNTTPSESGTPALDLDAAGQPVVAWPEGPFANSDVRVAQWNGSAWLPLGADPVDDLRSNHARMPDIDIGPNGPVVAWIEGDRVIVKRWAGTGWVGFGGANVDGPSNSDVVSIPSVAVDVNGNAYVAWTEFLSTERQAIRVARGSATGWNTLGPEVNSGGTISLTDTPRMQLALTADGVPVVAYASIQPGDGLQVRRWDAVNSAWARLGPVLGAEDSSRSIQAVSIDIAPNSSEPIVAWHDGAQQVIRVFRFQNGLWSRVGPSDPALFPSSVINLAVADGTRPVVIYNNTGLGQSYVDGFRYEP